MMPENEQQDSNTLAGEYVLGTLQGQDRIDFEQRLNSDVQLQGEVDAWHQRFAPMLDGIEPVTPPNAVWDQIAHRIEPGRPAHKESTGFWNSLSFWRNLGMVAATLVLALGMTLMTTRQQGMEMDSIMVVLNDQYRTGWLVGAHASEGFLNVKAVEPTELPKGKVCQLWMEDERGHLHPIGLLPHNGSQQMDLPNSMSTRNRFKVSVELMDLLPKDKPSSEIVFEGKLTEI
ncbi:MAG: anti-sigma factor [Candidatus Thiodiazotropha sp. (ex Lucinoma borealis)]|nr:anti-sigma factor [Candidatus Thiodiazotropha sp. (ex Lucinoma borealis)]MCU7858092.1 anti-sigma factor [Candidatus Thiodiazotropha sp. (ex Lucinoma borealis)]MCU7868214.1 anti-sigma factor [Candidatus Thiodiazotropha sp. (ex Lucinoma borealis)]